jgi:quinol monooxygenase YgiN
MAEHASVIRILRLKPASGKRDEMKSRLEQGVERIRQSEGCFGVQVCTVREAPDELAVISRWASQSALDAFLKDSDPERGGVNALASTAPVVEHLAPV